MDNIVKASPRGHGRNGADACTGAEKVVLRHESLQPGDPCPKCEEGTVYETGRPGVLVRLVGQSPIQAKIYELQKLRCNLCSEVFTAKTPEGSRGLFTSGIVSTREGRKIALFFSGRQHAGENLKDVLLRRAKTLAAPIQMCDALSRNLPAGLETIVAHCLAHGRRQFVDVAEQFPEECRYVLESLSVIYRNDAIARERNLSPSARRHFHQSESGPTMEKLHIWLGRQLEDRLVEPNSSLGGAISYMLKHWDRLALFLRVAGAPLDNNICERALKRAILHRKNALFYKTCHGALPPAEVAAWCKGMIGSDRVGFIYDEELRTLQNHFEASRS